MFQTILFIIRDLCRHLAVMASHCADYFKSHRITEPAHLVSDQHLDNVLVGGVGLQLVEPVLDLGEGIPAGDVIDDDDTLASSVVAGRQCPESFLSGSVPDSKLHLKLNIG